VEGSSNPERKPLAARVAGIAVRSPKRILLITGIAILVGAPLGMTAFDALDPYEFEDPGTDSAKANEALEDVTGIRSDGTVIALVDVEAESPQAQARIAAVATDLAGVEGVERVITPFEPPQPALIATDGQSAFVVGEVDADADSSDVAPAAEEAFAGQGDVELGGVVIADDQIATQAEDDLRRAEVLAFPLLLLLSLIFFRGLVAAALPLVLGGIAIVGSLAAMRAIHEVVPMSVLAINVVTGLGLGLAIDYSLFIVSRYREELARGLAAPQALERTLSTSGKAITFSGITVACALASLLVFPQQFLYSVAISGIAIALLCAVAALFVLPALLSLLGERVNALSPARLQRSAQKTALPDTEGRWYRFSHWVMRHPGTVAVASAAVLIALALPAFGIKFAPQDASLLPDEQSAGKVDRTLAAEFKPDPQYPVITQWVTPTPGGPPPPWVIQYRDDALALGGVVAVPPPAVVGENIVRMDIFTGVERATPKDRKLVDEVEDLPSPPEAGVRVGGLTASQIDEEASVLASPRGGDPDHDHVRRPVPDDRIAAAAAEGAGDEHAHPRRHPRPARAGLPGRQPRGPVRLREPGRHPDRGRRDHRRRRLWALDRLRRLQPQPDPGAPRRRRVQHRGRRARARADRPPGHLRGPAFCGRDGRAGHRQPDRRQGDGLRPRGRGADRLDDRAGDAGARPNGAPRRPELVGAEAAEGARARARGLSPTPPRARG
jgi:hypothetical protein